MHTRLRQYSVLRTLRQRFVLATLTGAFVLAALLVAATPAAAADNYPCTRSSRYANLPYACPVVWPSDGKIPLYDSNGRIIDYLHRSTGTQYFQCESRGGRYTRGSTTNVWWAWTQGDAHGRWGWVPEVFLKGGANDEPDAGLPTC